MLTRRELMASGGALVESLACGTEPTGIGTPLNVRFLFPDQMRGQAMGCMGNSGLKTPNLGAGHGQPPAAPEQRPAGGGGGVRGGRLRRIAGAVGSRTAAGGRGAPGRGNPLSEPRAGGRAERPASPADPPGLAQPLGMQGSKPSNKHGSSLADPNIEFAWAGTVKRPPLRYMCQLAEFPPLGLSHTSSGRMYARFLVPVLRVRRHDTSASSHTSRERRTPGLNGVGLIHCLVHAGDTAAIPENHLAVRPRNDNRTWQQKRDGESAPHIATDGEHPESES